MTQADQFLITEAQRRADAFTHEVEVAHLLAQRPKAKGWRYHTAQGLLGLAARLEPQPNTKPSTTC